MPPSPRKRARRAESSSSALYDVPTGLLDLYNKIGVGGTLSCDHELAGGYTTNGAGKDGTYYCGDSDSPSYVYWMSNMDVGDGGDVSSKVCADDPSWLGDTAYQDTSGKNIDAVNVPFVVINDDSKFNPTSDYNIQPLSVVAVICGGGGKMLYGVWADTNALGSMGEASYYLANECFPDDGLSGNLGHDPADVLYIAFAGDASTTVPSGSGSDADALKKMGDALVAAAFGGGSDSSSTASGDSSSTSGSSKTATSSSRSKESESTSTPATAPATAAGASSTSPSPSAAAPSSSTTSTSTGFLGLSTSTLLAFGACLLILIAGSILAYGVVHKSQAQFIRRKRVHDKIYYGAPSDGSEDEEEDPRRRARKPRRRLVRRQRSEKEEDTGDSESSDDVEDKGSTEEESGSDGSEEELVHRRRRRKDWND